jgi:hypothetical protein
MVLGHVSFQPTSRVGAIMESYNQMMVTAHQVRFPGILSHMVTHQPLQHKTQTQASGLPKTKMTCHH